MCVPLTDEGPGHWGVGLQFGGRSEKRSDLEPRVLLFSLGCTRASVIIRRSRGFGAFSHHPGTYVWLASDTNKDVATRTRYTCTETGQLLLPANMKYYIPYGGEKVRFCIVFP